MTERPVIQQNPTHGWPYPGWMGATKQTEDTRVTVGVVLRLGRVHPVVLSQHVEVELCEHALPRTASREGAASAHEGVEDSEGKEVVVEVGGALERQDNVGQVGEGVGTDDRGTTAGYLWRGCHSIKRPSRFVAPQCIYMHMYTHTYIHTHNIHSIHTHTYIHKYIHTYTHTHIHTCTYTHTYIRTIIFPAVYCEIDPSTERGVTPSHDMLLSTKYPRARSTNCSWSTFTPVRTIRSGV